MTKLKRPLIICGLMLCLSGGAAMATQGIVKTKDGRTLVGDVNEKDNFIAITVHGIETDVPRENIESVQYVEGIQQQYKLRLAKLSKNGDAPGHLELAKWLFENKQYDSARTELDTVLRIDPNNAEATTLSQTVEGQMKLDRLHSGNTAAEPPTGPNAKPPVNPGGAASSPDHHYISLEDVNTIRQMEWSSTDTTVKTHLEGDVRKKYLQFSNEKPVDFAALSQSEQAWHILTNGPQEMRKDVKILNDPAPLAEYRRIVQPLLVTGCAAAGCHAGPGAAPNAGGFFMYTATDNEQASYTNFYLLTQYRKTVGGSQRRMIDRTYPAKSLLEEFALPADASDLRHPDVPASVPWKGIPGGFRNRTDVGYKKVADWMGHLAAVEPDYGISYTVSAVATQPAQMPPPAPPAVPVQRPSTQTAPRH